MKIRACATLAAGLFVGSAGAADADLAEFHRKWVWSVPGGAYLRTHLDLQDLNGDGRSELLATVEVDDYWQDSGRWWTADLSQGYRQTWAALADPEDLRFALASQLGAERLIALVRSGEVEVLAADTKETVRVLSLPAGQVTAAEIQDLDGDGTLEIAVCDLDGFYVSSFTDGTVLATRYGFGCSDLAVGQFDDDPQLEIALAGNTLGGFVFDGASLQLDWVFLAGFGSHVDFGNADLDEPDEIVANIDESEGLQAIDPGSGDVLWTLPEIRAEVLMAADLDSDGISEILFSAEYTEGIPVLNLSTGAFLRTIGGSHGPAVAIDVADVDSDDVQEVVWLGRFGSIHGWARVFVADAISGEVESSSDSVVGPIRSVLVENFDSDAALEVVVPAETSDDQGDSGTRFHRFSASSGYLESRELVITSESGIAHRAVAANLDGDPQSETCLLFSGGWESPEIRCMDSVSGEIEWALQLPEVGYVGAFAVAELDGDATPELIVASEASQIIALEGESGWLKWSTPPLGFIWTDFPVLRVGNVLGDDGVEVVAGGSAYSSGAELVVIDAETGALAAPIYRSSPWVFSFDLAERDGTPGLEIVAALDDRTVAEIDPTTGAVGPVIHTFSSEVVAIRIADVSRDLVPDLVVVSNDRIVVWGGGEGSILWTSPFLGSEAGRFDTLWVTDLDRDSILDLAVNTNVGLAVYESPLEELFLSGFESGDLSDWTATQP